MPVCWVAKSSLTCTSTTSFFSMCILFLVGRKQNENLLFFPFCAYCMTVTFTHDFQGWEVQLWLAHVPPVECTPGKPTGYQAPMKMFSWIYSPVEVHIQPCLVLLCALQRCLTGVNMQDAAALSLFCQHPAAPGRSVSSSFLRLLLQYMPPTSSGRGPACFISLSQFSQDHTGFLSTD